MLEGETEGLLAIKVRVRVRDRVRARARVRVRVRTRTRTRTRTRSLTLTRWARASGTRSPSCRRRSRPSRSRWRPPPGRPRHRRRPAAPTPAWRACRGTPRPPSMPSDRDGRLWPCRLLDASFCRASEVGCFGPVRDGRRGRSTQHCSNLLISLPRAVLGCLFFLPCLPVCRAGSISRIWSPCRRNDHYGFTAVNSKHNDKFKRARDTLARAVRSRRRVTRRGLRRSGSLAS